MSQKKQSRVLPLRQPATQPLLTIRNLTVRFKLGKDIFTVIDNLSFSLKKGKTLALVGESGSGKSVTALAIMGILPKPPSLPPEGEVLFQNQNLLVWNEKKMKDIRGRKIAMIFQDPLSSLNPVYTIGQQLKETLYSHFEIKESDAEKKVLAALEDVHLDDPLTVMKSYPHQLSGGMLQRAMIAMALLCDPEILIADEPTTALDVSIQAQILHLLRELQEKRGMATLMITHDMGVVAENADEVVVLYCGQKVEEGHVEDIFDNPGHPYTQGLFASRPSKVVHGKGKLPVIPGQVPSLKEKPFGCHFHPRCPWAMELCKKGNVPDITMTGAHAVKCWLYDQELQWKLSDEDAFRS